MDTFSLLLQILIISWVGIYLWARIKKMTITELIDSWRDEFWAKSEKFEVKK